MSLGDPEPQEPPMEELAEEEQQEERSENTGSDFGDVIIEGDAQLEQIRSMTSILNEMLIQLRQQRQENAEQKTAIELLAIPRNHPRSVAYDMFNRWRDQAGFLLEMESKTRAVERDLKTLDRLVRNSIREEKRRQRR